MSRNRFAVFLLGVGVGQAAAGEELGQQVLEALQKLDSLVMRVNYTSPPCTVPAPAPPALVADVAMARGGRFRVCVLHAGKEVAGVCSDGTTIFEWDSLGKRWTRYAKGGAEQCRLIPGSFENAQLAFLVDHYAGSWLDPGGPYEWWLQRLQLADEVTRTTETVVGRPCNVLLARKEIREGPFRATNLARLAYESATHLPVLEECSVELSPELAADPPPAYRFSYEQVLPNGGVSSDLFVYRAPEGFNFVDPQELRPPISPLVGQLASTWNLESLDGRVISFDDAKKQSVVVTTAAWCLTCKAAVRALSALPQEPEFKDVQVVVVSLDRDRSVATRHLKELPAGLVPVNEPAFHDRLGLPGVPTILIVGPDGRVAWVQRGWSDTTLDAVRQALRACGKAPGQVPPGRI